MPGPKCPLDEDLDSAHNHSIKACTNRQTCRLFRRNRIYWHGTNRLPRQGARAIIRLAVLSGPTLEVQRLVETLALSIVGMLIRQHSDGIGMARDGLLDLVAVLIQQVANGGASEPSCGHLYGCPVDGDLGGNRVTVRCLSPR